MKMIDPSRAFSAQGCGAALFDTVAAFREFREDIRQQQAAIVRARAALARGEDADGVRLLLEDDLRESGMDEESIQKHIDNPQEDVNGLFVRSSDLPDEVL